MRERERAAVTVLKTSRWEARLAAGPDFIKEASLLATALVKLFIKKKSAPPCPQVFAGGATKMFCLRNYILKYLWSWFQFKLLFSNT